MEVIYDVAKSDIMRVIAIIVGGGEADVKSALNEVVASYESDHQLLGIRIYESQEAADNGALSALATWRAGRGLLVDYYEDQAARSSFAESLDADDNGSV